MKQMASVLLLTLIAQWLNAGPIHANEEQSRARAHAMKQLYWDCLTKETLRALPKKLSGNDFSLFVKPKCPDERIQFSVALVDYLALKFPDVPMRTHLDQAQSVIQAAIDDVVSSYVEVQSRSR
jgi:hypothetical protein